MPVRDFLLDNDGNRVIVNGDFVLADGEQAIAQGCKREVKLLFGEVWYDESQGVRWLQRILVKGASRLVVNAELAAAFLRVPDVTGALITSYSVDAQRHASIAYALTTGAGTSSGTVSV